MALVFQYVKIQHGRHQDLGSNSSKISSPARCSLLLIAMYHLLHENKSCAIEPAAL